jgi:hypothetical protein
MAPGGVWPLDAGPDGKILVSIRAEQEVSSPITLVLNWSEDIKR